LPYSYIGTSQIHGQTNADKIRSDPINAGKTGMNKIFRTPNLGTVQPGVTEPALAL
jgi:hypothetical protein